MPGLRRTKKRRRFVFDKNRKRANIASIKFTREKFKVENSVVRRHWDNSIPFMENVEKMGLCTDPNSSLDKIKDKGSSKKKDTPFISTIKQQQEESLERANKIPSYRFSDEQIKFITGMMDKHGDDFETMARDPLNHYQETAEKIRRKIQNFIASPYYFTPYAKKRGLI